MEQGDREIGRFGHGTGRIIGALKCTAGSVLGSWNLRTSRVFAFELGLRGLRFARQAPLAVDYKGHRVECGYRIDLVIEDQVLIEVKTVERLLPIHEAQVITYLRAAKLPVGLLVNFNTFALKDGLRRLTPHKPNNSRSPDLPVHNHQR